MTGRGQLADAIGRGRCALLGGSTRLHGRGELGRDGIDRDGRDRRQSELDEAQLESVRRKRRLRSPDAPAVAHDDGQIVGPRAEERRDPAQGERADAHLRSSDDMGGSEALEEGEDEGKDGAVDGWQGDEHGEDPVRRQLCTPSESDARIGRVSGDGVVVARRQHDRLRQIAEPQLERACALVRTEIEAVEIVRLTVDPTPQLGHQLAIAWRAEDKFGAERVVVEQRLREE